MAESLEQAWELSQKGRNNVIIGGNLWLKMGNRNILNAIDLSTLGLDCIEEDESGATYLCKSENYNGRVWICPVTLLVFNEYPQNIYLIDL